MTAMLLAAALACSCPCDDFAADVARRAELMAADVDTMPHVVKEGLRQLAYDARLKARPRRGMSSLSRRTVEETNRALAIDWAAIEQAIRDAAKETR